MTTRVRSARLTLWGGPLDGLSIAVPATYRELTILLYPETLHTYVWCREDDGTWYLRYRGAVPLAAA